MSNVYVVVDDLADWPAGLPADSVISFETYLAEHPRKGERKTRIINLCDPGAYLSRGYYCSLLAEARGHRALPTVNTLTDLRSQQLTMIRLGDVLSRRGRTAAPASGEGKLSFRAFFGQTESAELRPLARRLFERFAAPILEVDLVWQQRWQIDSLRAGAFASLNAVEREAFVAALIQFTQSFWRSPRRRKSSRWDLAILVNPQEAMPPSDPQAIKRIERAARKVGFLPEIVGPADYGRIGEFDALFIRETTAIDHHTYQFARKAEIEGLAVMDDPTSILRCCNKVFLQDAFSYNKVPTLRTRIVARATAEDIDAIANDFGFPVVLKIPDGSFSRGVRKAEDHAALEAILKEMLSDSALVIAQEYLYTEFDWRIGVLNNRPLYACRYYMARNHWQIYDHSGSRVGAGGWETLPTYEVPKPVLEAALRSARIIGDGLYGIDIKQSGQRAYVIEVNDNPSLEHGVEDAFLGDELYMQIMSEFARRLERRGR